MWTALRAWLRIRLVVIRQACRVLTIVVALIAAVSPVIAASAWRVDATFDGKPVTGAEVCFARATEKGTVLERLAAGPEYRCLPADTIISLPAGTWSLFLRASDPLLVGTHSFKVVSTGESSDSGAAEPLNCPMTRAADFDISGARKQLADETLWLYIVDGQSAPSMLPVAGDESTLLMPMEADLRLVATSGPRIVRVGPRFRADDAELRAAPLFDGRRAVVIPAGARNHLSGDRPLPTVLVRDRAKDRIAARAKLHPNIAVGLLVFEDLSPGTYDVQLDEVDWSASPLTLSIADDSPALLVTRDLDFAPADGVVRIEWSVDPGFFAWTRQLATCAGASESAPSPQLRLYSCEEGGAPAIPALLRRCSVLRSAELPDAAKGEVKWPADGASVLQLSFARMRATHRFDGGPLAKELPLEVTARRLFGRVTRGGDPVDAELECGTLTSRTEPSTGAYECWAREIGPELVVAVSRCGSTEEPYRHRIARDRDTTKPVDIELPDNELRIVVRHEVTNAPIEGARVVVWPGSSDTEGVAGGARSLQNTDAEGMTSTTMLQPDAPWVACAFFKNARACKEEIHPEASGRTTVELSLEPKTTRNTRIVAETPIVEGIVFTVDGTRALHRAAVGPDGSVDLQPAPPSAAHVLVSRSHALCVLLLERVDDETFLLRVPPLQPRSFVVRAPDVVAPVTVILGSMVIPVEAFSDYQGIWQQQYVVQWGTPLRVAAVDASRGVTVILGRAPVRVADPFSIPEYFAAMPKLPLTAEGEVVFP